MKYQNSLIYLMGSITTIAKSNAQENDRSVLSLSEPTTSTYLRRSSGPAVENKVEMNKDQKLNRNRALVEQATTKLFKAVSTALQDDDCCLTVDKFIASDGGYLNFFGSSCSISNDLVIIGAYGADSGTGAAYLFDLNGNELKKLTPGSDESSDYDFFGATVSMDEKVAVGTGYSNYVRVFSREGTYERTIKCDDCSSFGGDVVTFSDKIVMGGSQDSIEKLLIYTTEGELLKEIEQGSGFTIGDVAMSDEVIAFSHQQLHLVRPIYSNTEPDFTKIVEINQGGQNIAVSGDKLVIGDSSSDGAAYLYNTDGTLVKTLEHNASGSLFGSSVEIMGDLIFVGAPTDSSIGSILIYSSSEGEFVEKKVAPVAEDGIKIMICLDQVSVHLILTILLELMLLMVTKKTVVQLFCSQFLNEMIFKI